MARNTHCWIPDAEECYVIAKIVSEAGAKARDGSFLPPFLQYPERSLTVISPP